MSNISEEDMFTSTSRQEVLQNRVPTTSPDSLFNYGVLTRRQRATIMENRRN